MASLMGGSDLETRENGKVNDCMGAKFIGKPANGFLMAFCCF